MVRLFHRVTKVLAIIMLLSPLHAAQAAIDNDAIMQRLMALEENQRRLEQELAQRDGRIAELEQRVGLTDEHLQSIDISSDGDSAVPSADVATGQLASTEDSVIGRFNTGGRGITIAESPEAKLNFSAWSYVRYLNQRGLNDEYTDSFGREFDIDKRNDFQVSKVNLTFSGWLFDPAFRWMFYTWTSNTSQGESAQVVVAGNMKYQFNDYVDVGLGIDALPGTRSMSGTFPRFHKVDSRAMADEFFRPSYTTGIWSAGKITDRSQYKLMLGNNLSQLGVNANRLDDELNTWSGRVDWMPTTGEFGPQRGFDDWEMHEDVATLFGIAATRSKEDRQSQPGEEDINNSQIRLSDGTRIFEPGAFNTNGRINRATYEMLAMDAGMKYKGFSLMGEYYWRWVSDFEIDGDIPVDELYDHGFQIQTSYMFMPKYLQGYVAGSKIYGEYGDPWDTAVGINWFPLRERLFRVNSELVYMKDSAVGYSSIPYAVGGDGVAFHTNVEMKF
ncbi:hypothetical protein [Halioglobus maricola]|uniref:hypothetical protein n=1 Tax=Halioglobus maricola TaxID=2601894 RepID=UPI00197A9F5F|nr:hypothetical protein [Halioglobus maricola]